MCCSITNPPLGEGKSVTDSAQEIREDEGEAQGILLPFSFSLGKVEAQAIELGLLLLAHLPEVLARSRRNEGILVHLPLALAPLPQVLCMCAMSARG